MDEREAKEKIRTAIREAREQRTSARPEFKILDFLYLLALRRSGLSMAVHFGWLDAAATAGIFHRPQHLLHITSYGKEIR